MGKTCFTSKNKISALKSVQKDYENEKKFELATTELNENALMYLIDIGQHGLSSDDFMLEFKKIEAYLKKKDGTQGYR